MDREEDRDELTRPDIEIPVDLPTSLDAGAVEAGAASVSPSSRPPPPPPPRVASISSVPPPPPVAPLSSRPPPFSAPPRIPHGSIPLGPDPTPGGSQDSTGSYRLPDQAVTAFRDALEGLAKRIEALERASPSHAEKLDAALGSTRALEARWAQWEAVEDERSSRLELVEARLQGGAHRDSSEFYAMPSGKPVEAVTASLRDQEGRLQALEDAARNRDERLEALEETGGGAIGPEGATPNAAVAQRVEDVSRQLSRLESDASERFGALEAWRLEAEMAIDGVFPPHTEDRVSVHVDELRSRMAVLDRRLQDMAAAERRPADVVHAAAVQAEEAPTGGWSARMDALETRLGQMELRRRDAEVHVGRLQQRLEAQLLELSSKLEQITVPKVAPPESGSGLQRIRGIGPKFERLLRERGVCDIKTIATWDEDDIEEFAALLGVSAARIRRDGWVDHARSLVANDTSSGG